MSSPRENPIERVVEVRVTPAPVPIPEPKTVIVYRTPVPVEATREPIDPTAGQIAEKPWGAALDRGPYNQKRTMRSLTSMRVSGQPVLEE